MPAQQHHHEEINESNSVGVEHNFAVRRFVLLHRQLLHVSYHSIKHERHRDDEDSVARESWRNLRVSESEENQSNAHCECSEEVHRLVDFLLDENRADEDWNELAALKDDLHGVVEILEREV